MDRQTDRQMNDRKSPCVLQDLVPFRAAAQKAKKISQTISDRQMDGRTNQHGEVECPRLEIPNKSELLKILTPDHLQN